MRPQWRDYFKSLQEEIATGSESDFKPLYCTCPVTALHVWFIVFSLCSSSSTATQTAPPAVDTRHIKNWTLQMIACYDAIIAIVPWTTYWLRFKTLWLVNTLLSPFHCAHISSPCSSWLYKLPIDNGMCVCTPVNKRGTLIEQKLLMMVITFLALQRKQVIPACLDS